MKKFNWYDKIKPLIEWFYFIRGECIVPERREELREQIDRMKAIRKDIGLNRREFSEYMGIPLRTLEEWEAGRRKMPDYVLRLIAYQVKMEQFLKKNGVEYGEDTNEENG